MNHDAIVFDIDGTLWNACSASAKGWNAGLAKLGIDKQVSPEHIERVAGYPFETCVDLILPGIRDFNGQCVEIQIVFSPSRLL